MNDSAPAARPEAYRKQALATFLYQLLLRSDEEEEALERLVKQLGPDVAEIFGDFDRLVDRMAEIRRHVGPILALVPGARTPPSPASSDENTEDSAENRLSSLFETLDRLDRIAHVAKPLADAVKRKGGQIGKIPRKGSRGNGLLYILDRYGRKEGLSLKQLMEAFTQMGVVQEHGQDPRRVVQWEASELMRRGWPVEKQTSTGRYRYVGPKADGEGT